MTAGTFLLQEGLADGEGVAAARGDASGTGGCADHTQLRITPRDAFGRRAYLAPLGLSLTVEVTSRSLLTLHLGEVHL